MDQILRQVMTALRSMWKHRWLGVIVAWIIGVVGAVVVWQMPDKYEASARIYVDTQSILKPLMAGLAVQPNVEQQVSMLSRTLISRPNVEKLIRMADLDLGTKSKAAQEELVDGLMKSLEIKSTTRDNLYTLAYRHSDPAKAKRVVQSLVSIFVESSLGDKRNDSDTAKKFLDEQIKIYEKKLVDAEEKLKEFKLRNIDIQTSEEKGSAGRIADITNQLSQARLELREAENARDALKRQILGEITGSGKSSDPSSVSMPEIDARIDAQKRNLDALLQRYTESHPDVVGARRIIRELEQQKVKDVEELRKAAIANPSVLANSSAASSELKRELTAAESRVASLRARVGEYDSRYARARASMKDVPELEAQYAQLTRDYNIHKKNYEDLVSRRESASMSGELESAAGVADFRLIDPPRVSPSPVAPNRMVLLPLALLASLAAGFAAAFLASRIWPVFMDARALREMTGLPLLGIVSKVSTDAERRLRKKDLRRFAVALGSLLAAFVFGIVLVFFLTGRGV